MTLKSFFPFAICFCSLFAAAGDLELTQPHVAVYGTAEIKVTPNEMIWSLNVNTKNETLQAAAQNHTAMVKQVLEFLKSLKIKEDKLQTSRMQFGEEWKTVNREHVKVGYFASTDITFTITDFDLYEKLWFGLADIKGVSIQSTHYSHTDRIKYQDESRKKAVLAARKKAEELAQTLGTQIMDPLKIEEIAAPSFNGPFYANKAVAYDDIASGQGSSLALGQITINTQVKVYFKLMSRP